MHIQSLLQSVFFQFKRPRQQLRHAHDLHLIVLRGGHDHFHLRREPVERLPALPAGRAGRLPVGNDRHRAEFRHPL